MSAAESRRMAAALRIPLLGGVATLLLLSYGFPWLRIPSVAGVPLPLQRGLGWLSLLLFLGLAASRKRLPLNGATGLLLGSAFTFCLYVIASSIIRVAVWGAYAPFQTLIEASKYVAAISAAYLTFCALRLGRIRVERFEQLLVLSGTACILVTHALLILYWAGFRTTQEVVANAFGNALGVWPTGTFLPRLAGPTAEPQQLSVVFLTPLMLMMTRSRIRRWWPVFLLGLAALLLSQSKFVIVSLALVFLYAFFAFRGQRLTLSAAALLLVPVVLTALIALPTFRSILDQGLQAQAFTERLSNNALLFEAFSEHPLTGIGLGQFGTYRGEILFRDPGHSPGYAANNDYLTLLGETGFPGFAIVFVPLAVIFLRFLSAVPRAGGPERSRYLALLFGAYAIALNMLIGYEFMHVFFWINVGALLHLYRRPVPRVA